MPVVWRPLNRFLLARREEGERSRHGDDKNDRRQERDELAGARLPMLAEGGASGHGPAEVEGDHRRQRRRSDGVGRAPRRRVGEQINEKAMAKVFWAKMLAAIEAAGIGLPACHPREWVAHWKSVGSGEQALIYLVRYLYRGVIRGQDSLACGNGRMSFRHRSAPFPLPALRRSHFRGKSRAENRRK